jgi:hypothetical protein
MNVDHSQICKFDKESNPRYQQVIAHIEELVQHALGFLDDKCTSYPLSQGIYGKPLYS